MFVASKTISTVNTCFKREAIFLYSSELPPLQAGQTVTLIRWPYKIKEILDGGSVKITLNPLHKIS